MQTRDAMTCIVVFTAMIATTQKIGLDFLKCKCDYIIMFDTLTWNALKKAILHLD